jgi:hypothetical protein
MTAPSASWLYAVIGGTVIPAELRGVGGHPVRLLAATGSTSAVVSSVDERIYGASAIQHNARDLGWLEKLIREHNGVVEECARHTTTLPVRLGTVFTGDDAITDLLATRAADLTDALEHIAGRREWGVKLYRTAEPAPAADSATGNDARPGTAYLLRRRAQQQAEDRVDSEAMAAARTVHARLADLADDHRSYPAQDPRLDPAAASMALNATYLVRDDCAHRFLDTAERCRQDHPALRIEVTGPWPVYTFASTTLGPT